MNIIVSRETAAEALRDPDAAFGIDDEGDIIDPVPRLAHTVVALHDRIAELEATLAAERGDPAGAVRAESDKLRALVSDAWDAGVREGERRGFDACGHDSHESRPDDEPNAYAAIMARIGAVPPPHVRVFFDGDSWCATRSDFVNLATSHAGFGSTVDEAVAALLWAPEARAGIPSAMVERAIGAPSSGDLHDRIADAVTP